MPGLPGNRAFPDGCRRMASALSAIFLGMNGFRLPAPALEGEDIPAGGVMEGKADPEEIARFPEAPMRKAQSR